MGKINETQDLNRKVPTFPPPEHGKKWEDTAEIWDPFKNTEPEIVEHKVERPCGHMQVILRPKPPTLIAYKMWLVPELRAELAKDCPECGAKGITLPQEKHQESQGNWSL